MTTLWDPGSGSYLHLGQALPPIVRPNTLWYNPTTDLLQYWDGTTWVPVLGSAPGGGGLLHVGALPPGAPVANQLWYNPAGNVWTIFDGTNWNPLSFGGSVTSGGTAPVAPAVDALWFNPTTGDWSIWDGVAWVGISIAANPIPPATALGQVLASGPAPGFPWGPEFIDGGRF